MSPDDTVPDPYLIVCPVCHAPPGQPCRTTDAADGVPMPRPHLTRQDTANEH